jgi:type I restriction enzyme S subunit
MEENNVLIPEGWERVKFSEYISFQEGPGLMSFLFREVGFPFINIRCIENGNINKESCQFLSEEIAQNQYKHFQLEENDLIVSTSGTLGKKAFVKKSDLPLLLNTSIIRFKPKDTDVMSLNFLNFLLEDNSFLYNLYSQSTGSAQVNVGPTHLKKLFITIPKTSKEQNKIAEILSKVDNAISETEIIIAKYNRIKTGLMQDLLAKGIDDKGNIRSDETHEFKDSPLGRIPKEWKIVSIDEIANLKSGGTPSRQNPSFWDGNISWVKTGEVNYKLINSTEEKITEKGLKHSSTTLFPVGTILMALYGQGKTRGRVALLAIEASTNQACLGFLNLKNITTNFLYIVLTNEYNKLRDLSNDGAQKNLSGNLLKKYLLKIPSEVKEQLKIDNLFFEIERSIIDEETKLLKLKSTKKGLMQDLLSGKKRVTNLIN